MRRPLPLLRPALPGLARIEPSSALAVAVVAALTQWLRRRGQLHKAIFDGANFAISAAAASVVFHASAAWRPGAAVLAGCVFAVVNNGLLCLAMSLAEGASWRTIWLERFHWARFHFALFGPVALAASIAYEKTGIAGLAAFALPPALMMLSVRQYLERTTAAVDEIRQANLKLRRAHRDTIAALSRSMEAKDVYTGGHTERVAALAVALARKLGFRGEELEGIVLVADAFDALTSARPYRPARSTIAALAEIREHTGTQFCPGVVAALEELARTEPALVVPEPEAELHVAPHVHVA